MVKKREGDKFLTVNRGACPECGGPLNNAGKEAVCIDCGHVVDYGLTVDVAPFLRCSCSRIFKDNSAEMMGAIVCPSCGKRKWSF